MTINSASLIHTVTHQVLPQKPISVWVCDEDIAVLSMIRFKLQRENYRLKVAAVNPSWMLEILPSASVNLLIIDAGTYLDRGLKLIQQASSLSSRHIPILALLAEGQEKEAVEVMKAGASDFLIKPFSLEELYVRVLVQLKLA